MSRGGVFECYPLQNSVSFVKEIKREYIDILTRIPEIE